MRVGERFTNASAFIHDTNLYAMTPKGLQASIDVVCKFLSSYGMSINVDKSFALGFRPSGQEKKTTTVDTMKRFEIGDHKL